MFWVLKEPSHRDFLYKYPQHIVWLRNKKNNFWVRTLNFNSSLSARCGPASNSEIQYIIIALVSMPRVRHAMKLWGCSPNFLRIASGISNILQISDCVCFNIVLDSNFKTASI